MKKLAILLMTVLFAMEFVQLSAQDIEKQIKSEVKAEKKEVKAEKKEIKSEKEVLRRLEGTQVNEVSILAFKTDFSNASDVNWTRGDFMDEAAFTINGKEMMAYYDADSKLIGTLSVKTTNDLPLKAQETIKSKYKDFSVKKVIYFDDNEGNNTDMIIYGTQFDDADYYFVEMAKANEKIVLQVNTDGDLTVFKKM